MGGKISNFHWTRRIISRRGLGGIPRERGISCVFVEGKGGKGKYGKEINSYVGKDVIHEKKKYVQTRAWKEVVCSKYLKWSS